MMSRASSCWPYAIFFSRNKIEKKNFWREKYSLVKVFSSSVEANIYIYKPNIDVWEKENQQK